MGDYTGFKWAVRVHDDLIPLAQTLVDDELDIDEISPVLYPRFDNDIYNAFRTYSRASGMFGCNDSAYLDESWVVGRWFRDGILYACGSLKNYDHTIEVFTRVLPMFGDSFSIVSVFDSYDGDPTEYLSFTSHDVDSEITTIIGEYPMARELTDSAVAAWPYSAPLEPSEWDIKEREGILRLASVQDIKLRNVRVAKRKRQSLKKTKAANKRKVTKNSRKSNR